MQAHLPALDHGGMDPAPCPYLIRIDGHLGATMLSAFPALAPQHHGAHIRSIYAKLGVRDRSSAVRRARELRLLAAGRTP